MSDSYEINGVKITPAAGGYYDLEHASLPNGEPERVRGKEKADQRAAEIAKAAESPEGSIPPQGTLQTGQGGDIVQPGDTRSPAERAQENAAAARGDEGLDPTQKPSEKDQSKADKAAADAKENAEIEGMRPHTTQQAPTQQDRDDEVAELRAQLKAQNRLIEQLVGGSEKLVKTVETMDGPEPSPTLTVPTSFTGEMDSKVKAALGKLDIEVTKVVLEESENIPPTGLFISHNGKAYMISPGTEVDVPEFLLGVLDDAVMSAPVVDATSQKVLGYRNRSKYPYRRIK